jgi:hypothetical protein
VTNVARAQVIQCINQFDSGTFDENTVRSLYTHLREPARVRPNSLTVDIGDFFAHPERNRGLVKNHIDPVVDQIVEMENGRPWNLEFRTISHVDILADLDNELREMKLIPLGPREEIALALFASFQGTSVKLSKRGLTVRLGFYVLPERDSIQVCGNVRPNGEGARVCAFPIFSMPNVFKIPRVSPNLFEEGWTLVRVPFVKGQLDLFQTHELIEQDMPKRLKGHAHIRLETRIEPRSFFKK